MAATIPVMQYGNLQPSFTVEAESHSEAMELALEQVKEIWDRTAKEPLSINQPPKGEVLRCRVSGAEVIFDPVAHTYHSRDGRRYTGGSTFAGKFTSEFPGELIAGKMATKHNVKASEILSMWELNAFASQTFGTSMHAALQLYGEYLELSRAVKDGGDDSALTSNPVLRPIVLAFFEGREDEKAYYEEFVADARTFRCGLIDRLVVEDDGLWVEDFKSNKDVHKSETILEPFKGVVPNTALGAYWLQLSYYSTILQSHGRIVKGLRVHHWTGTEWVTYEHPVVDLSPALG